MDGILILLIVSVSILILSCLCIPVVRRSCCWNSRISLNSDYTYAEILDLTKKIKMEKNKKKKDQLRKEKEKMIELQTSYKTVYKEISRQQKKLKEKGKKSKENNMENAINPTSYNQGTPIQFGKNNELELKMSNNSGIEAVNMKEIQE